MAMERFNPCTTDACTKQCDSLGVRCEDICIDEIERLRKIAHSDDGAGGDGMRLYLEHREMRSLLERLVRNPENVSHATGLREDLMAWAKKTHNDALRGRASAACEGPLEGIVMRKEEEC
ncbi:MAG TPA: hypothetical protein PLB31_11850 [Fimbriimonadaceae bacterium]|nr:hypothetical protein [Fimbriimonadaceae bacterium]